LEGGVVKGRGGVGRQGKQGRKVKELGEEDYADE